HPAPTHLSTLSLHDALPLAPAVRSSWASFGPSFTHDAWMLGIEPPSITRASACILTTSRPVAPGRTPGTRRLAYIGASEWMSESGTNSVKPPVPYWMART